MTFHPRRLAWAASLLALTLLLSEGLLRVVLATASLRTTLAYGRGETWAMLGRAWELHESERAAAAHGATDGVSLMSGVPMQPDPVLGLRARPGHYHTRDGDVTIGENGFRVTRPAPTSPEAPTLVTIGDSFTFGYEVADEQTWTSVLATQTGLRVVNLGMNGMNDTSALLALRTVEVEPHPEVVVQLLLASTVFRTQERFSTYFLPYARIDQGRLVLEPVPNLSFEAFSAHLRHTPVLPRVIAALWREHNSTPHPDDLLRTEVAVLTATARTARDQGAAYLLAFAPMPQELRAPKPSIARQAWQMVCEAEPEITCLDLAPALYRAQDAGTPMQRRTHWTPEGHAIVGEAIAHAVEALRASAKPQTAPDLAIGPTSASSERSLR